MVNDRTPDQIEDFALKDADILLDKFFAHGKTAKDNFARDYLNLFFDRAVERVLGDVHDDISERFDFHYWQIIEKDFDYLVKLSEDNRLAWDGLSAFSSKFMEQERPFTQWPIALKKWSIDKLSERIKPPTYKEISKTFYRDAAFVYILNYLKDTYEILPSRNEGTEITRMCGVEIIRKLVKIKYDCKISTSTIANCWKNRDHLSLPIDELLDKMPSSVAKRAEEDAFGNWLLEGLVIPTR